MANDYVEKAAAVGVDVTGQAAAGNVWALIVVIVIVGAALVALWIFRTTGQRPPPDPDPPACETPPAGCPAIQVLAAQVAEMTRQLEDDREERRQHRAEVNHNVSEIHRRIDQLLLARVG